jgi:AcrR family transcriptional regulator
VFEDPTAVPDGAVVPDPGTAPPEAPAAVVELRSRPPVPETAGAPVPAASEPNITVTPPDDVVETDGVHQVATSEVGSSAPGVLDAGSSEAGVFEAEVADGDDVPADAPGPGRRPRRRDRRGPNLREQRRQRTREAIVDAAAALFVERGFDAVSVSEIAQRAGVVEKTVFNHFPVKEGLVFESDPPMRAALLDAVRRRPAGESVAAAAGGFVVAAVSQLGDPAAAEGMTEMTRVIRGSRTLQGREREILGALTDSLAEQITLETRATPGELEPWLAANAVLGLYSSLLELARDRVLAGASGPALVTELRTRGQRGLALLQFGLAGYAKRR